MTEELKDVETKEEEEKSKDNLLDKVLTVDEFRVLFLSAILLIFVAVVIVIYFVSGDVPDTFAEILITLVSVIAGVSLANKIGDIFKKKK